MKKYKKPLLIAGIVLDVAITVFLLVISIIMLFEAPKYANVAKNEIEVKDMISAFQKNPTLFLITIVIPLFILLVINIIGLVIYVRKSTKKEPVQVDDLSEEQKEALRQELLKELGGGSTEPKQEQSEENKE